MRASQHEACGSWSIYNQWQWKRFICCRQHRAMLIGHWYMLDCQEWEKRPLAASGARWTNRGGWRGRKSRLNWKGKGTWGREEWSSVVIASTWLFGSSVWRESAVGRAADCWTGNQACFNYQQLASLTNDTHACLHIDRWPRRLQCLWSCLVVHSVIWSLHCIGSITLPPTMQWLRQNPSSHCLPWGTMDGIQTADYQWCSQGQNLKAKAKAIVPRPRPLSIRIPQKLRYAVRLTAWQDR